MTVEPLLSTKLQAPMARPNTVARPRLVARLAEGLRLARRLTLVSAPPGFGKTTLIQDWIAGSDRRAAWLSLDEGDNDPGRFMRYLIAALSQADECIGRTLPNLAPNASSQELLTALINDLAAATDHAAGAGLPLVLDDYHAIRDFAVHELVAFLLANQPAGFHLVIGTREDPPLPLARLRARDQITEIREHALRFTAEEGGAFFNRTMGLSLAPESVATLLSRTEGWITGLQLAGVALRQPAGGPRLPRATDDFVAAFAGDDRYIVDYLMAEVLERESESVRDFLRRTSILERLSASLCDDLTGRDDSSVVLEHLEAANLFLLPLDNRREWFRYHVLFTEVLRLSLTAQEQIELHRRAAAWFETHGWPESAAHHTRLAAEASGRAGKGRGSTSAPQPLIEPLSERELEVLRLIAAGYSNQEIADRLIIAQGTVKRHINNLYGKLQVGSRTQAVATARDLHIL
jgi:LuxR family transcriptional regulator, maltose regulon positive regulatory protein